MGSFASFRMMALFVLSLVSVSAPAAAKEFRVGIVLDKGGRDDKSFNAAAFRGSQDAEKKLGIKTRILEGRDDNSSEPMLRSLAERKYDLIIAVGFSQGESVRKVATQFKDRKFVIIDSEVDLPNVKSVMFEEHEGSFLVGAIAALKSKTGSIGFIGGMDIPLIRRFLMGYEAGAKHINKNIRIFANYAGVTGEAWNNPPKGKELTLAQISQGADVIFAAAGATGMGMFDAVEEKKVFAIGVDSNQNWVKPGRVLTSMIKRVDNAVYKSIEEAKAGTLQTGIVRYGLSTDGVAYALDEHNKALLDKATIDKVEALKSEIIAGKIVVPDFYKLQHGK